MAEDVVKRAVAGACAEIKLANRVAHTISRIQISQIQAGIGCAVCDARVRRFRHPNPHEPDRDWSAAQANGFGLAFSIGGLSLRKHAPGTAGLCFHWTIRRRIFAAPVLDYIAPGIRLCPCDANAGDLLLL